MVAALANTALMQPRPQPLYLSSLQSTASLHLYVSVPVATVICTLLGLMIGCTIWLAVYARRNSSVLTEDPTGLLGRAIVILRSSEVMDFVAALELQYPAGQLTNRIKKDFTWESSACWPEGDNGSCNQQIRLQGLHLRP